MAIATVAAAATPTGARLDAECAWNMRGAAMFSLLVATLWGRKMTSHKERAQGLGRLRVGKLWDRYRSPPAPKLRTLSSTSYDPRRHLSAVGSSALRATALLPWVTAARTIGA